MSTYTKTYTTFSGADIVATFDGKIIGELQAITYSVTREKAPVYTMGSPNPRSFSRGKRGIAGSLVFTVFDRDSLHGLKEGVKVYKHSLSDSGKTPVHELSGTGNVEGNWSEGERAKYSDEIPPFDVVINFLNEYGQSAKMEIKGVEILNEGSGMSIDDITTEKACTFVAREIVEMEADTSTGDKYQ